MGAGRRARGLRRGVGGAATVHVRRRCGSRRRRRCATTGCGRRGDWPGYAPHRTRWKAQEEALFVGERPWEHADAVVDNGVPRLSVPEADRDMRQRGCARAADQPASGGRAPRAAATMDPADHTRRASAHPSRGASPSTPRSGPVSGDRPRLPVPGDWPPTDRALRRTGVVAVAGEALVDLVPAPVGGYFEIAPGGSPANVALGLARLGVPARLLARIADDLLGRRIREHLTHNGVQLDHAVAADGADVAGHGVARRERVARLRLPDQRHGRLAVDPDEVAGALDPGAAGPVVALHSGSLALTTPPGDAVLRDLLACAPPRRSRSATTPTAARC